MTDDGRGDTPNQNEKLRPDYAHRKRNFEWRQRWFELAHGRADEKLAERWQEGFRLKERMIKRQRSRAEPGGHPGPDDHMAGYAPAGAGTPWVTIGPRNVNGRVKALAVHPTDPNIVYAGAASGGVWKSTDGGQSWRPLWDTQDTMAIGALAIAPSAPGTIYAGTGEWTLNWSPSFAGTGVFVSTDDGDTWTQHTTVASRRIAQILVSPTDPNVVYVAGTAGFERSGDGGANWTTLRGGGVSDALIDPVTPTTLYIYATGDGLYKSTNEGGNWTKLTGGAPTGLNWVRLAMGENGDAGTDLVLAKWNGTIYRSIDGGTNWSTLSGSHGGISYHAWCNLLAVAPDDDDIILAGGGGLERTATGGTSWSTLSGLHADHHRAIFAPSNTNIVYTCNDGGVYRSTDKGASWVKASNGLIVTQFYDVGVWAGLGTVAGGGAQDNGTLMTTGGLTWREIFDWDGGYLAIHPTNPRTMYAERQHTNFHKSIDGGNTWVSARSGVSGSSPWVGVFAIDPNTPDTLFLGTNSVWRTTNAAGIWTASSQSVVGDISGVAVAESDSQRVYACSTGGRVYRSDDNGVTNPWTEVSTGLPAAPVTDIVVTHTDPDRVAATFAGTGHGHVFLSTNGGTVWTDVTGNLPDVSASAFAFDPINASTFYVGTDVGVFRTTDGGTNWEAFDNGLPNAMISDLAIDRVGSLLIASTFGRGMYKVSISGSASPNVDLYLRDSILDTGERFPSPSSSGIPNPNDPADWVFNWESPDIKVDSLPYYTPDALFDGVEFDELQDEDPQRTEVNRFYLQLHNRGWQNATDVSVRAFLANASAGLPPLPNPLVAPDFNLSSTANWTPLGAAIPVPLLEPNRPVIVSWDFTVPATAATHSCVLAVISSAQDPIANPEVNIGSLLVNEKRVCLKNLHVINSSSPQQMMETIEFHNNVDHDDLIDIEILPARFGEGAIGLLLPPIEFADLEKALEGVRIYPLREDEDIGEFDRRELAAGFDREQALARVDRTRLYEFSAEQRSALRGIKLARGGALHGVLTLKGPKQVEAGKSQRFTVMQRQGGTVVGGSTYELRPRRARKLMPVSRIRIVLEKLAILDLNEPWFKGRSEFRFDVAVTFNGEACRRHVRRVPEEGVLKIARSGAGQEHDIDLCIFDGYVAENDRMEIAIIGAEQDFLNFDDSLTRFRRSFGGYPESWVGRYGPDDEAGDDPERMSDWRLWYRIESVPL